MTTTYERERELQRDIVPRVERSLPGVEVLALELLAPTRFCVYVDHPAGVDHALCGRVTDLLRDYLREYTVDVSSPGPARPLRTPEHFGRFVGRRAAVRTAEPVTGRNRFKGTIVAAQGDVLALDVGDGGRIDIPYESVVRANLIDEG